MTENTRKQLNSTGELEEAIDRKDFYRKGWRTMLFSLPLVSVALICSVLTNVWLFTRSPEPRYFATESGRITPLAPLNVPYVDDRFIRQWAAEAVTTAYQFDFQNYRNQFDQIRNYFTAEGYEEFKLAMAESRLPNVISNFLVSSATVTLTPVITNTTIANGVFLWKIQVPVTVSLGSDTKKSTQRYVVTIIAARTPTHANPFGIAISKFIESPI